MPSSKQFDPGVDTETNVGSFGKVSPRGSKQFDPGVDTETTMLGTPTRINIMFKAIRSGGGY
jgi:hypothetical protein